MQLASVRRLGQLCRTASLRGARGFHDVASTTNVLSHHPALASCIAFKHEDDCSIVNLVALAQSEMQPTIGAIREYAYDSGFTGCLKSVTYLTGKELDSFLGQPPASKEKQAFVDAALQLLDRQPGLQAA
jgi:hypothetical protein